MKISIKSSLYYLFVSTLLLQSNCKWEHVEEGFPVFGVASFEQNEQNVAGKCERITPYAFERGDIYVHIYAQPKNIAIVFHHIPSVIGKYQLHTLLSNNGQSPYVESAYYTGFLESPSVEYELIELDSVENFIEITNIDLVGETVEGRFQGAYHGISPFTYPPDNKLDTVIIRNGSFLTYIID